MDVGQAKVFKNRNIRLVENRMAKIRDAKTESYDKNESEIDQQLRQLVGRICEVQPLDSKYLTKTFHNVIDNLFYKKRPTKRILAFLNDLSSFPPEVIFESVMAYSMYLHGDTHRKKHSVNYFLGFVRNKLFAYNEKQADKNKKYGRSLPDDL